MNEPIRHNSSVTLDWNDVVGATHYHLQVSLAPDFATRILDVASLTLSNRTFSDGGANDAKRFWRWRSSDDNGVTWSEWSEVGGYWLKTSYSESVELADGEWALVSATDVLDRYVFLTAPLPIVAQRLLNRIESRNRKGALLTEYITSKAAVELDWSGPHFLEGEGFNALRRFNEEHHVFFLVCKKYNGVDFVPHVWKVQFTDDPRFTMLAAGRPDYYQGVAALMEA